MRLRRWFRCEFWVWILFLIRNTEFLCCTIQICAQHGSHNENIPQKVASKFNWALSGCSYSRLTFWVRRRTCLLPTVLFDHLGHLELNDLVRFVAYQPWKHLSRDSLPLTILPELLKAPLPKVDAPPALTHFSFVAQIWKGKWPVPAIFGRTTPTR